MRSSRISDNAIQLRNATAGRKRTLNVRITGLTRRLVPSGVGQRQGLRDHLADHDVQVRDDAECHEEPDRVRRGLGQPERLEGVVQPVRDGGLAVHAETDRGERDAELGHGDVAVLAGGSVEDSEAASGHHGLPPSASASMRDRRLPTSANSAATNTPLTTTSAITATMGRTTPVTRSTASTLTLMPGPRRVRRRGA